MGSPKQEDFASPPPIPKQATSYNKKWIWGPLELLGALSNNLVCLCLVPSLLRLHSEIVHSALIQQGTLACISGLSTLLNRVLSHNFFTSANTLSRKSGRPLARVAGVCKSSPSQLFGSDPKTNQMSFISLCLSALSVTETIPSYHLF